MPKLFILKGLPGSGKSTYALEELRRDGNTIRVNRDELRTMLHGNLKWSGTREKATVAAEKAIVRDALLRGQHVIVDDTNLLGSGVKRWQEFATSDAHVEIVDFTDVSIATCIERDRLRTGTARVGRGVIERMALTSGLIDLSKHDKVAIVDVDGTLANLDHRLHFLERQPKDYDGFFKHVVYDEPIQSIVLAVRGLELSRHLVIILSGRPTTVGYGTEKWLLNADIPFQHLFMRQGGNHQPDNEVKYALMASMLTR